MQQSYHVAMQLYLQLRKSGTLFPLRMIHVHIFTIDSCVIFPFQSADGSAGSGIYFLQTTGTVVDSHIDNNGECVNGGGVTINSCQDLTFESTTINSNMANNGGGVYIIGATSNVSLDNCKVNENVIDALGGGIYILAGELLLSSTDVKQNNAISPEFTTDINSECLVVGGCFTSPNYPNNYPDGESCFFNVTEEGTLDVKTFHVKSGSANQSSGVSTGDSLSIEFADGSKTQTYTGVAGPAGVTVKAGDVIYWNVDGYDTDAGFEICYSTGGKGGGIYGAGGVVKLYASNVSQNEAVRYGGGLYGSSSSVFMLSGSDTSKNTAGYEGNDAYLGGGTFNAIALHITDYDELSIGGEGSCCATCSSGCSDDTVKHSCVQFSSSAPNCFVNCHCDSCSPGYEPLNDECSLCSPGLASENGTECLACEPGTFAKNTTTVNPSANPTSVPLSLSPTSSFLPTASLSSPVPSQTPSRAPSPVPTLKDVSYFGATHCEECKAGKHASTSYSVVCSDCDIHTHSVQGQAECSPCKLGFDADRGKAECSSIVDKYYISNVTCKGCTDVTCDECLEACPVNAICKGGNYLPIPKKHYWSDVTHPENTQNVSSCLPRKTCVNLYSTKEFDYKNYSVPSYSCWKQSSHLPDEKCSDILCKLGSTGPLCVSLSIYTVYLYAPSPQF